MNEPSFAKREPRPYDYQEMTWEKFINLREWAKVASNEIGYPIYLVGSTLYKVKPRDFDIVIIIPIDEYENMFGKITDNTVYQVIANAINKYVNQNVNCADSLGGFGDVPLDFKVYPDTWFVDDDKLLLAKPKIKK